MSLGKELIQDNYYEIYGGYKNMSKTKIVTPKVRLSFVNVFKPKAFEGSDPKYSVHVLIPKKNKQLVTKIKAAIDATIQEGIADKWGGKKPKNMWDPLRDGDVDKADEYPEYEGMYYLNAKSNTKPGVVDQDLNEILDSTEVYSGCYGRVSLNFFPYKHKVGGPGVGVGLNNVQKLADGEMLGGGRASAEDDFADDFEDEDDLLG